MLTARRDPLLHPGASEVAHGAHHPAHVHSPGFNRFMTVLQVVGSIVGIPLGLASGYSIYHANFSVEARCQGLRANIVSMLDKSADASTLRVLVRRDVASFETSCGTVDPDAVAAFKTLLAHNRHTVARRPEPAKHAVPAPVAPVKEAAKPAPAKAPAVEARRVERDTARADANWVASVRAALIHAPAEEKAEAAEAPAALPVQPRPLARATVRADGPAPIIHAPAQSLATPAPAPRPVAPALPPATSVVAPPKAAADHPVPPASIPEAVQTIPAAAAAPAEKPAPNGIRGALAEIPLLGRMIGK